MHGPGQVLQIGLRAFGKEGHPHIYSASERTSTRQLQPPNTLLITLEQRRVCYSLGVFVYVMVYVMVMGVTLWVFYTVQGVVHRCTFFA